MSDEMTGGRPYPMRVDPEIQRILRPGDVMIPSDDDSHALFCRNLEGEDTPEASCVQVLAVAVREEGEDGSHYFRSVPSVPDGVVFSDMELVQKH